MIIQSKISLLFAVVAACFTPTAADWDVSDTTGTDMYHVRQAIMNATSPPSRGTFEGYKTVNLGYATYQSNVVFQGVMSFLGIRFAAPPTGELRWRAPQPPGEVFSTQNATVQPPQCPQAPGFVGSPGSSSKSRFRQHKIEGSTGASKSPFHDAPTIPSSEDCLFLNVHTPANFTADSALPVVLYIHGGGYDAGNTRFYPAQDFVQQAQGGLVAVQVQYRLGVLGFLPGQAVKDGGDLNAGLLDQEYALRWIHSHITSFGGDPDKVTIWGQSAGAGSVLQHLVARGGQTDPPLFRAAIMQSPFLPFQHRYSDPIPEQIYSEVVAATKCNNAKDTLGCLRDADVETILLADSTVGSSAFMWTYTFVPVVDGTFIRERPTESLLIGPVNGEVLYVNTVSKEGRFFVNEQVIVDEHSTFTEYVEELFPTLDSEKISRVVSRYETMGLPTVVDQAAAVMGDNVFVCPAYYALKAFGLQNKAGFKSEFALSPGLHAQDLSYVFTHFDIPPSFDNAVFQSAYSRAYLFTVINLNPNNDATPEWPSWTSSNAEMLFNKTDADESVMRIVVTDSALLQRCEFWVEMAAFTAQ